ncbi:major facilitator superfamily domain-containing protein, partial [Endogone sp. FLAS-F59071]
MKSNDGLPPTLSTATLVQPPAKKTFLWLPINPRISRLNFVGYLVTTLFSITFFVFLDSSQTFVLSELLGVTSSSGTISGDLAFYDELLSIFLVALWGSLSDRIGRRPVAVAGYLMMGLGLFVFTTAPNVYPALLLCRLTFAIGAAAASAMITALTGDYSGAGGRGKVAAVAGLFSGLGALIGVFVLLPLPAQLTVGGNQGQAVKTTFYITGGIAFAISLIAFALLKGDERSGWEEKGDAEEEAVEARKMPFYMLIYKGFAAGKDLRVSLAYVCGFV